jgi:citrate synthase
MANSRYLSAKEAAKELNITQDTLYAYVSRGLLRSEVTEGRIKRYLAEDIRRLKERKERRRNPDVVAEGALHLGAPVMESAITLLADQRFYYRGRDALVLATTCSIEQVAFLIWTGELLPGRVPLFDGLAASLSPLCASMLAQMAGLPIVEIFQALLSLAAAEDVTAYDLRASAIVQTGARILRMLTTAATGEAPGAQSIAETLQQGWIPTEPRASTLLNAALILCADHELNVTTFTARCVASAGATPYAVVIAGLAALSGYKHAGASERVEAFLQEAGTPGGVRSAMQSRLRRGEPIPGFGHPLYPDGDPRGRLLLDLITEFSPDTPSVELAHTAIAEARDLLGEEPNIDFAMVTLVRALHLSRDGAITLRALGRTIGWIGHAIEQYGVNQLIRPRARYTGELPQLSHKG